MPEFLRREAPGQMAGHLHKDITGGECKVVGVLYHFDLQYEIGPAIAYQGEYPAVGSDEPVFVEPHQGMRCGNGGLGIDGQDMDGARRKIAVEAADDECRLVQVEGGNIMGDLNDLGSGQITENGSPDCACIVIFSAPVAGQCDDGHRFIYTFACSKVYIFS